MSYQVLARKWRPRSFLEMVGQEHVLRALINALDNDRLHHAFLFTGTRGVGKTSIARILAKSLNCEQGVSSRPCGECSACREIDEGRFVDLVEVDAASRTRVEDTRELLENVQYAPSRGRYKVYLVDEVHMLSNHSFNALLKTLEEPPPHVKFLLATTDPQRLPVTILSRCLQFNLKRLPLEPIRDHLFTILEKEGVEADRTALVEIARAADGSMRDALSLLDQAVAYGAGQLIASEVRDMLGTVDRHQVVGLIEALAGGDAEQVIAASNALAERAPDFGGVLNELNSLLQRIALAQVVPAAVDDSGGDAEAVRNLAERLLPEDVQLFYQIGIAGRRDLPLAPDARSGFEMVLLRMLAFRPAETVPPNGRGAPDDRPGRVAPRQPPVAETAPPVPANQPQRSAPKAEMPQRLSAAPFDEASMSIAEPPAEPGSDTAPVDEGDWEKLVAALPLAGMSQQFALHCALARRDGDRFELMLDRGVEHLSNNPKWERALKEALESHLGRSVQLSVTVGAAPEATPHQRNEQRTAASQSEAEQAIRDDSRLNSLLERFDGQVDPESIRPVD